MPNKNGLILIKPSSIASTGTGNSSSINTNGSVTFSTCATLSLNGVFSADYDNYMVVGRFDSGSTSDFGIRVRLRSGGTDNTTASSYTSQYIFASGTSVSGNRSSADYFDGQIIQNSSKSGGILYFYGPYLSQPTAFRTCACEVRSAGVCINDVAGTHNQSTSYDGFTIYMSGSSFSGLVCVYGMRK